MFKLDHKTMNFIKTIKLTITALFISITINAQQSVLSKKIDINKTSYNSFQLIKYIEIQTGFSINYSESVLKIAKTTYLKPGNYSVKYLLDKIFSKQVEYVEKVNKILVRLKQSSKTRNRETYGNSYIVVHGKICEKNTSLRVALATISIKGEAVGTVSNADGEFTFYLPEKYLNDSLHIACFGYKSYGEKVTKLIGLPNEIRLEKKVYDLSEVKVKPKDPMEIVAEAIARIPDNYPIEPTNMDAFYREMTFENDTCVQLAEAACEFYYRPYNEEFDRWEGFLRGYDESLIDHNEYFNSIIMSLHKSVNPKDQINIKEARASDLHHKHRFKVVPTSGPWAILGGDGVKQITSSYRYLKRNKFELIDINEYDGNHVYKILVTYKKKPWHKSKLYIETKTMAIVMHEFFIDGWLDYKNFTCWSPALYKKKKRKCLDNQKEKTRRLISKYKKVGNKWVLNYLRAELVFDYIFSKHYIYQDKTPSISYKVNQELLINNVHFNNVTEVKKNDGGYKFPIQEYDLSYDSIFWKNYNIIQRTAIQDSIINQLEKKESLEKQFSNKFLKDENLPEPIAKKQAFINPYTKENDNYKWLENSNDIEVLNYIKQENNYTKNFTYSIKELQRKLLLELAARYKTKGQVKSIFLKNTSYEYYYRKPEGGQWANFYRKKIDSNAKEELVIDIAKKTQIQPNYFAFIVSIKPDNSKIAYIEPITDGYDSKLIIKDLNTGQTIDSLEKCYNVIWTKNDEFLYTCWNDKNRADKILKHTIGKPQSSDELIYYEKDESNQVVVQQYEKHIILQSMNDLNDNNIVIYSPSNKTGILREIVPQKRGFSHFIQIESDTLYLLSEEAKGKTIIYKASMAKPEKHDWIKLVENSKPAFFEDFLVLKDFIIVHEKENMLSKFKIFNKQGVLVETIDFKDDETYAIKLKKDKVLPINVFQFSYSSLVTPGATYQYNINKQEKAIVYKSTVPGYHSKNYKCKLLWATSKDGVKVPISLVYNKKKAKRNSKAPTIMYAYGGGDFILNPTFNPDILSLLDRGCIYAIAHVRGGGELGIKWHKDATLLKKKNTFNDFIACAEHLISEKYTSKREIVARGASYGGLTMGVVANWRPDLFNSVIAEVPYLDVLNNLSDSTANFVTIERKSLGNPMKKEFAEYIKSYSPYDGIKAQDYPNMLFVCGLLDTRAKYWNAVKSVAKLRDLKTDDNALLLKTNLFAGHNGYSGEQQDRLHQAFVLAFILNNLNIKY